jgi:hypothetical protein
VKKSCFKDLNFYFGLGIKLFLVFYYLKRDILSLLMVVCLKNSPKGTSSQYRYYLVLISYGISHRYFWIPFAVRKILLAEYPSRPNEKYFIVLALLSLKCSKLFIETFSWALKLLIPLWLCGFFADPYFIKFLTKEVVLIGRKFFMIATSPDDDFIDAGFAICRVTRLCNLND